MLGVITAKNDKKLAIVEKRKTVWILTFCNYIKICRKTEAKNAISFTCTILSDICDITKHGGEGDSSRNE